MISLQTIELAISKGHVRSFGELEYCTFRYCEQFSQELYSMDAFCKERLATMTALTKQQLVKEIERLVQDGMDSRWLKGKAQVKVKIEGGRVTGLDTLTVE